MENVQKRLIALNYLKDTADGYFGSNTEGAVKDFQKNNKLKADGKVGAQTLKVLLSDTAKKSRIQLQRYQNERKDQKRAVADQSRQGPSSARNTFGGAKGPE